MSTTPWLPSAKASPPAISASTPPPAADAGGGADALVATFRDRASQLPATSPTPVSKDIAIAGQRLDGSTVTAVGTVEIADDNVTPATA
jgi:hypothetical protein